MIGSRGLSGCPQLPVASAFKDWLLLFGSAKLQTRLEELMRLEKRRFGFEDAWFFVGGGEHRVVPPMPKEGDPDEPGGRAEVLRAPEAGVSLWFRRLSAGRRLGLIERAVLRKGFEPWNVLEVEPEETKPGEYAVS
jgi:hypothetical protein